MAHWYLLAALALGLATVAMGCGGLLYGQGSFNSPNYPGLYPNSQSCSWVITADVGKLVKLQFTEFDLEYDMWCSYDNVKVYDGVSSASLLLGSFCGSVIPQALTGSNVVTVVFKSDIVTQMSGFLAQFQSVYSSGSPATAMTRAEATTPANAVTTPAATSKPGTGGSNLDCRGDYVGSTGSLSSPGYPSSYPNLANCSYTITVPKSRVVLTFSAVDIEFSASCNYDYLEVRDESASGNLLAKVCGNTIPGNIIASGSRVYLTFVSDSSVQKTGFQASWQELTCDVYGGDCINKDFCNGKADSMLPCLITGDVCCTNKVQDGGCGTASKSRIVGGNVSAPHGWPWQVSLQKASDGFHFCGASVISSEWVVTAAHCVNGKSAGSFRVVIGEHDLKELDQEQILRIKSITVHESYQGSNNDGIPNDIALIRLTEPIIFSRYVQPVCLPQFQEEFGPADNCWITGWGDTRGTSTAEVLNELKIEVLSRPDCRSKWGASYINEGHICVGNGLTGACNGDSGGPLVCEQNQDGRSRWVLAGATSWGRSGCQMEGYPSVYTRISYFLPWIESKIRESIYNLK